MRSWAERAEAQWAAFAAIGVSEVENDIIVDPSYNEEILSGTYVQQ